jgi:PPIC-type PPIASE domain
MPLTINGDIIDDDVLEAEFNQIKGHYERSLQVACCERDPEFQGMAKENIVARTLLGQECRTRYAEVPDAEITDRLERLITEAGGIEQFYMNIGVTRSEEALVREHVADGVRMDKMLADVYAPEPTPTAADLRAYYDAHLDQFMTEEQIEASHITKGLEGAKSRRDVYETMRGLRQQLQEGYDFHQLAEEHRGGEQQQIDLGWFKRGEFMEEFETIAFSMTVGELSPVFTTALGFHICKLTGRRPSAPAAFEEITDVVHGKLVDHHRDTRFNDFITQLKAAAKIEDTSRSMTGEH